MLALLLAIGIHADFEAGNIGRVERVSEQHFRCAVQGESDQNKRNRQPSWFYFRMDGIKGRDLTVDLVDLEGEYNFKPHDGRGLRNTRPAYSYDNRTWKHFDAVEWIAKPATLRLRFRGEGDRIWIARQAPYTTRDLAALLASFGRKPELERRTIGRTVEGRPMEVLTVTDPRAPLAGKKVIWLMARQHSWESGTSWVAEGALKFLLSASRAARIRRLSVFRIVPMADPDGVARGGVRFNKNGYDLNRNWDAIDPKLMPEIAAQRQAVLDWVDAGNRIDFFLSLHNTEAADFIEGPEFGGLGQRFWKLLVDTTAFHSPGGSRLMPETTTAGMKGRMTACQGLFAERKIPAFLMEQMVDSSPKLSRPPTVADRLEFGAALVRAMAAVVGL